MSLVSGLTGIGMPAEQAVALGLTYGAVTAAGTTVTDATEVGVGITLVDMTATGSDGIKFSALAPLGVTYTVMNSSASTGKVYGSVGCNFSGGSDDAAISIVTHKSAQFIRVSATRWLNISSA